MIDSFALLAQAAAPAMTTKSWLFLGLAWLFVTGLLVWSFCRVLGGGPRQP